MVIGIPKEIMPDEKRVAAIPDTVAKFINHGFDVHIEKGAGAGALYQDDAYIHAGATLAPDARAVYESADVILKVKEPMQAGDGAHEIDLMREGYAAVFVGVGATESARMRCEGEDAGYQCFMTGIEFLRRVSRNERPMEGKKLLVIGEPVEGSESYAGYVGKHRKELDAELEKRAGAVDGQDSALLMYTSGSTGKPKGVVHTHYSIIENIKVEIKKFYFRQGGRALLHFPINHVAADVEIGFAAIMVGGCIVCMDRFDPAASLAMVEKEKLNVIGQVPVMFLLQMMQPGFKDVDWSKIELFAWAGSAAPKAMIDALSAICKKTGANLITGYGSTEVCGFVTYTEKGDDESTLLSTAGKIAPPFELKIVDNNRKELPDGEVGEIAVRGAFMFKEYFNNPAAYVPNLYGDHLDWLRSRVFIQLVVGSGAFEEHPTGALPSIATWSRPLRSWVLCFLRAVTSCPT